MSNDRTVGGARREYERVADALRHEIEGGNIAVGEQLPTHAELVDRFDVSRATVQKAIKALESKGYVESAQGKGVFARDWRKFVAAHANGNATETAVGAGSVELDDAIAEAFEADDITIDAYCLTAESLNAAIVQQIKRIIRGEIRPSSIHLRLLLPRTDVRLAFPRNVDDPDDERPMERLSSLSSAHIRALRNLENLAGQGAVPEVKVEVRLVPVTPLHKLYLINGDLALDGMYVVTDNVINVDDATIKIHDVLGVGAKLYPQPRERVELSQEWFDSLWTRLAKPA
ncbi:winged helix-turn-helix domain-containing protein [Actinacidiphila glaucinigra]|uniref:winged helix-turn-helix domain-containing protein n=1 Tax=Actinacidiphila glaucinigra TaxID=235986 RepID=UPI003246CACF